MAKLSLAEASRIVDSALLEARKRKLKPMTVVVLDTGGHVVTLKREDGATMLRPQIATAKAWSVLGMGRGGRDLRKTAESNPLFFTMLIGLTGGNMAPVLGGVLIRSDGEIVGSVGVTGDAAEADEACAIAGIEAAGLQPDAGAA